MHLPLKFIKGFKGLLLWYLNFTWCQLCLRCTWPHLGWILFYSSLFNVHGFTDIRRLATQSRSCNVNSCSKFCIVSKSLFFQCWYRFVPTLNSYQFSSIKNFLSTIFVLFSFTVTTFSRSIINISYCYNFFSNLREFYVIYCCNVKTLHRLFSHLPSF